MLLISSSREDHVSLRRILSRDRWKVHEARSYREAMSALCADRMPVVICESSLPDGNWKDVLGQVAPMADAPRLIVTSFHADDRLWAEVLNMGGFDVLLKPLDESEVLRVVDLAWRNWEDERQHRKQRWKVAAAG